MYQPSAKNAVSILSKLQGVLKTENLAYFVFPNTILTLSGARAYCDGIFYHKDKNILENWKYEIEDSIKELSSFIEIYKSEVTITKNPRGENYVSYEIITNPGLKFSFEQSKIIDDAKYLLLDQKLTGEHLINKICVLLQKDLKLQQLNKEDIKHIAFGILLGYPDTAMTESFPEDESKGSLNAKIKYADYYICPQPVYSYPKHLENDPSIKAHEQLWSKILADFYESDFHKDLAKNKEFKNKIIELQKY